MRRRTDLQERTLALLRAHGLLHPGRLAYLMDRNLSSVRTTLRQLERRGEAERFPLPSVSTGRREVWWRLKS